MTKSNISIAVFENNNSLSPEAINSTEILQAFKETGVVLLRGWDFDLNSFQTFTQKFCNRFHKVATRAERQDSQSDGYSTNVFKDNFTLLAHTEGGYRPYWTVSNSIFHPPEACFFLCLTPPLTLGGETTLVDGCQFLEQMPTPLREQFRKTGLSYNMIWESERWQLEFNVEDIHSLRTLLATIPNLKYCIQDSVLEIFYTTEAITQTLNGQSAFATGLLAHLPRITHPNYLDKNVHTKYSNRVFFGDGGEEISETIINELIDIHDNLSYHHRWQIKDVLFIDNTRYLHGRTMTAEPCERALQSRFGWLHNL